MIQRTTVVLSSRTKQRAVEKARLLGISFGEFVRRAVDRAVAESSRAGKHRSDPFWDDRALFRGTVPADLSFRHDAYLYGDE